MSQKDRKKDETLVEEVNLDAIIGTDIIFDLEKIREKAILSKDPSPITPKREFSRHKSGEEDSEEEHLDEVGI